MTVNGNLTVAPYTTERHTIVVRILTSDRVVDLANYASHTSVSEEVNNLTPVTLVSPFA
jgi:hypothetical protein